MKKGYIRTASKDGSTEQVSRQMELLQTYGVDEIYVDEGFSGLNFERPQFTKMMNSLKAGDVIVTLAYDRITRSQSLLLSFLKELQHKKVELKTLRPEEKLPEVIQYIVSKLPSHRHKA